MKLKDTVEAEEFFTGKASDNVRALGLAGIGVLWLLTGQKVGPPPRDLLPTAFLLVAALAADFAHYLVASFRYSRFNAKHERAGLKRDSEVAVPESFNRVQWILFWVKVALVVCAYAGVALNLGIRFR